MTDKSSRTKSELLFEQYLNASGITDFRFEREFQETSKRPDYSLTFNGAEILFEVKEFQPTPDDFFEGGRGYDPYAPVREKIGRARDKFQKLKQYCCCLVIYNAGKPLVHLDWHYIYGAMLGDVGIRFPFIPGKGLIVEQTETAFLYNGKVRREKEGRSTIIRNTTISAILVLNNFRVGKRKFENEFRRRERESGRKLSPEERGDMISQYEGTEFDISLTKLRVVVHENPYARLRLPEGIFRGPYDERYGHRDSEIRRIFAGKQIENIEAEEPLS